MIVMLFMFSACSKKKNPMTDAITNRDSVPIMVTREVSTYISDSGVVRYKIIADDWKVYDRLDPSRWTFEEGVYLEKYDNKLNIEATILADTAYYYDQQELWELRGNVHIENKDDEQFDTFQNTLYDLAPQTDATFDSNLALMGDALVSSPASIKSLATR